MVITVGKPGTYNTHFAAYALAGFCSRQKAISWLFIQERMSAWFSEVSMIPELNLGIVVLTNNMSNAIDAITYQIMDSYLDVKKTLMSHL